MALFSAKIKLPFLLKTPKNIKLFLNCIKDLFPDEKVAPYCKKIYPEFNARNKTYSCQSFNTKEFSDWVDLQNYLVLDNFVLQLEDNTSLKYYGSSDDMIYLTCADESIISQLIKTITQRLESWKDVSDIVLLPPQKNKKIFISHASEDKIYVKEIVDLLVHMGVSETAQVFCTSMDGTGIPLRGHIYDYIKGQFQRFDIIVLMILSKNYYNSPACLNEMGATWISELKDIPILLPGFDFSQIDGAADPRNIAIKLDADNAGARLNELRDLVSKFLGIKLSNEPNVLNAWLAYQKEFLTRIATIKETIGR